MYSGFPLTLAQAGTTQPPEDAPPVSSPPAAPPATDPGPAGETTTPTAPGGSTLTDPDLDSSDGAPVDPGPGGGMGMWLIILVMLGVMVFFSWRSSSREKKQHQEMIGSLRKGDKVQTAGGILGTIVEVKNDEVTLKVDESSNTRVRVTRQAVRSVLSDKDKTDDAKA